MNAFNAVVLSLFLTYYVKCENGDLDSIIDEVFGPPRDETRNERLEEMKSNYGQSDECKCVSYYLCMNNTIITDGTGVIDIRQKEPQCGNYLEVCCKEPLQEEQRITPAPVVREGCGKRNPQGIGFRITGDNDGEAQFGEFPWMVAVLYPTEVDGKQVNLYKCGGALIHPQVVLTAAHCINDRQKFFKIRVGEWDTQTNNELFPHQDVNVMKVLIHPDFNSGSLSNDVGLLFLESPVNLAENVDTICLPRQGEIFDYNLCFASGWGTNLFNKSGVYQVILKKIELPIVPRRECETALRKTRLGSYFKLHDTFVCAGGERGKDTCRGDGGSPLVCPIPNTNNRFVQVGIVAWGISCGEGQTPGVYAGVASFRDWIDEQMLYHDLSTKYYEF